VKVLHVLHSMERSVAEVMLGQATPLFRERGVLNSRQVGRCSKNCRKPTLGVIEREEAADSVTVGCYKEDVVWSGVPPEVMRMSGHAAVTGGVVLYGPGGSHSTAVAVIGPAKEARPSLPRETLPAGRAGLPSRLGELRPVAVHRGLSRRLYCDPQRGCLTPVMTTGSRIPRTWGVAACARSADAPMSSVSAVGAVPSEHHDHRRPRQR